MGFHRGAVIAVSMYLVFVGVATYSATTAEATDELGGFWLLIVTLPWILIVGPMLDAGGVETVAVGVAGIGVCVALNAFLLYRIVRPAHLELTRSDDS